MNEYGKSNIVKWEGAEYAFAEQFKDWGVIRTSDTSDQYKDIDCYRWLKKEDGTKERFNYSIKNQMKGASVFGNITFEMEQMDTRTGEVKPGCVGYTEAEMMVYKIKFPEAKHLPEKYKHFAKKKFWLFMRTSYLREFLSDMNNIESKTTTLPQVEGDNRAQGRKFDRSIIYRVNIAKLLLAQGDDRSNVRMFAYVTPPPQKRY